MNDEIIDLVVTVTSVIIACVICILVAGFCTFMFKVCMRVMQFAWGIV